MRKPRQRKDPSKALTNVDKVVAANLDSIMLDNQVSDVTLAGEVKTHRHQIQKYRHAINRISAGKLWELAKALDVPIVSFFHGVD